MRNASEITSQLTAPGQPYAMRELAGGIRAWELGPRTLREVLDGSRAFGDRTFLVLDDERLSFEGHARQVAALAQHLVTSCGVRPGDRVAIAMRNLPEWSVAFWATVCIGAVAVPLNAWWTGDELAYALADSGSRVAVVDAERAERVNDAGWGAVEHVLVARSPGLGRARPLGPILIGDAPAGLPPVTLDEDAPATLFYTSGSTGRPKGVVGTHRNMASNLLSRRFFRDLEAGRTDVPVVAAAGVVLLTVPLFHVTGSHSYLLPSLASGSTLVLMRRWDVADAITLIERERVSSMGGVPFMALQLLDVYEPGRHDLSSLSGLAVGGAMAPPDLAGRLAATFPDVVSGNGYGMTETSSVAIYNYGSEFRLRPEAVGRLVPAMDLRIVPDGSAHEGGGELWLRGPNVVPGYWNRPEETAATFQPGGWLRTGDLAVVDGDGIITLVGRSKEIIVRGGENIAPAEVVGALVSHPDVLDAAVVGTPDRLLGEQVGAVIQVRAAGVDLEAVRRHVAARLAAFKVPSQLVAITGELPRGAQGKLLAGELREILATGGA